MCITTTTSCRPTRFVKSIFSDGSEEQVYEDDRKCVSTPKEQDTQLGGVKETAQDAKEKDEGVNKKAKMILETDEAVAFQGYFVIVGFSECSAMK